MNRSAIIDGIKREKGARIADLQKRYEITYREAKSIVDELVAKGVLVYGGGLKYDYIEQPQNGARPTRGDQSPMQRMFGTKNKEWWRSESEQQPYEEDDDEEDEERRMRIQAIRLCIQNGVASTPFLQRRLSIGYLKACKILDWMEEQGYVSAPDGPLPRQVIITDEEFEDEFNLPAYDDEIDEMEDLLDLFGDDDDEEEFDSLFDDDDEDPFEGLVDEIHVEDDEEFDYGDDKYEEQVDELLEEVDGMKKELKALSERLDAQLKPPITNIAYLLKQIAQKKAEEAEEEEDMYEDTVPEHPAWPDEFEFIRTVRQNIELIVKSDRKMGILGAIKQARAIHWEFSDLGNIRMEQVFERVVYELEHTSAYQYSKLKKKYFG